MRQRWDAFVRTRVWGMDIHATARIASSALIDRTWPRGVHIAEGCVIDEEAVILTHDLTRGLYLDTRIGAGTVIGARAIVLPGVTVGRGCDIRPGALVHRDMQDGARASGNPATIEPGVAAGGGSVDAGAGDAGAGDVPARAAAGA